MDRNVEKLERVGMLMKGASVITVWRWSWEGGSCWYFVVGGRADLGLFSSFSFGGVDRREAERRLWA